MPQSVAKGTSGGDNSGRFPLEGIQQAYWVGETAALELSIPARYAIDVDVPIELTGSLTPALNRVIRRHEMLRAIVLPSGDQKIFHEVPRYEIEIQDLRGQPDDQRERATERLRAEMEAQALLPEVWPQFVIRATLHDTGLRLHMRFALWMMDGWSFHILLREMLTLAADPAFELPRLEMSFADYVAEQSQMRQGPRWREAWNYWRPRLADFAGPPALPLTSRLGERQTPRFKHLARSLPAADWARVVDLCTARRLTPNLLACAVYSEVLSRFTDSRHFAITVLYSGRFQYLPRSATTFGNFGTTILLAVDASRDKTFLERVRSLQRQFWRDSEHIAVSGLDVSRAIQQRAGSGPGVGIPVTFTAVTAPRESEDRTRPVAKIDHGSARLQVPQVYLDHQLHICEDGSVSFDWDYVEQVFPSGFVEELCEAHHRLLSRLASDERALEERDPGAVLRPAPALVKRPAAEPERLETLFERRAIACPDSVAVIAGECRLSYFELRCRAIAAARELHRRRVERGELVAIAMTKGWEQIVAALAVLYAGAAYVPIDPELPEDRRNLLFAESGARVALTRKALNEALVWPAGMERIAIDMLPHATPDAFEVAEGTATDLAYVIFTSGSTGKPKGVMIDHRGAWNTIVDLNSRFSVNSNDRVLALSSLSFDLSVYDIFGALAAGATIVMPDAERSKEASHWRDLVQRHGVTIWNSVPALMQLAIEGAQGASMTSLRLVMLSGDWIPLSLPDRIRPVAPHGLIYSLGGATEASIWSILYPIERLDPEWRSIPYGRAMEHQSVHVLDADLRVCPPWVPGDLYIGGIGLALGYWRDEAKTAASFVIHPTTGERLYRTGDTGRYLADGEIEFLGRKDFQVKIQGYRVECAEVEAALLTAPEVDATIVSAAADSAGTRHLVAYVVLKRGVSGVDLEALRQRVRAILPAYMVPTYFVPLDKLPLSENGKVLRSALPKPDFAARGAGEHAYAPPQGETETAVAQLWRAVLGVEQVGREDNFFALGGSSFAGMRLAARLEERFGRRVSFAMLTSHPTVARLAQALHASADGDHETILTRIRIGGDDPPLFCIHPIGGSVMCYAALAQFLPPGPAIYGIRAPGLFSEAEDPLSSIGAMADRYILEIRAIQSHGPYRLLGWSLGGLVVREMACRLTLLGEELELAAMIDSAVPEDPIRAVGDLAVDRFPRFVMDLAAVAGVSPDLPPQTCSNDERFTWLANLMERSGAPIDPGLMRTVYAVFEAGSAALEQHVPRVFEGDLLLFLAAKRPDATRVLTEWRQLTPRLEVLEMDEDHYSIMRVPAIAQLAKRIAAIMRRDFRRPAPRQA